MSDEKTYLDRLINTRAEDILDGDFGRPAVAPRIVCADGTTLSVQASRTHYCTPRNSAGPWFEVEVGFPSVRPPDSWEPHCEDWADPTHTVYGYVPVGLVRAFIAEHGGEHESMRDVSLAARSRPQEGGSKP